MKQLKNIGKALVQCFKNLMDDKLLKLSASLAYTTVFSFGPLLVVVIFLCSIFLGQEAVQGRIYDQMKQFVGPDAALQLQDIIKNASLSGKGTTAAVIGIVTLIFSATAVFAEIQDSINTIWGFKAKPKKGLWLFLRTRFLSFSLVISLGFLLLVSLAVTTIVEGLSDRLKSHFPDVTVVIFYILNLVISFLVITALFLMIFKVLPDAKTKWKDVLPGAIASSVLFMIGKFGISFYIGQSKIGTTYGAAGSLVILLLWVYYSAIILYLGAEFAKAWSAQKGTYLHPNDYAVALKKIEIETDKDHNTTVKEINKQPDVK
ncbi:MULTISPECIES: YihY/virulence factor BrkB family protein [Niastella]|uniref:YihY/virulence factor BrkB family protein n=1 Tax=Niastella soli TaxID=2821487 RepID=A0ABS3YZ40_9BACT|nr:YihY/virulence factor BrkB family protein [Niastella soli]MBO9202421.1 YihY/virulence factor BrkB family protein [Niastella soli]